MQQDFKKIYRLKHYYNTLKKEKVQFYFIQNFLLMKDSLNSVVFDNFQKFHTQDFIESHNTPFLPYLYIAPPSFPLPTGNN